MSVDLNDPYISYSPKCYNSHLWDIIWWYSISIRDEYVDWNVSCITYITQHYYGRVWDLISRMYPTQNINYLTLSMSICLYGNHIHTDGGAGRSSEIERSLMVRWVVGSILHGVDPLSYFSFQPVLHNWCNKGCGMCYPVCWMVHIKEPLLLINKSSLCGGSGFPFSLSEWSLTICLTPYNRR